MNEQPNATNEQPGAPTGQPAAANAVDAETLKERIVEVLKTCYDPEIPIDIYELGLIYAVEVSPEGDAEVEMTLTSPACPVAESLPPEVEAKVRNVEGVRNARVDVVWDPPWDKDKMSEAAQLQLGFM